jgi:hypothetical protein
VEKAYLRILSQQIIDAARDGCKELTSSAVETTADVLDLSKSGREFVTAELAQELLKPLLAPGTAHDRSSTLSHPSTTRIISRATPIVCLFSFYYCAQVLQMETHVPGAFK